MTVVGVSGTAEVVAAWTSSPEAVVETIAGSLATLGTFAPTARRFGGGEQFVLVPHEVADILERGLDARARPERDVRPRRGAGLAAPRRVPARDAGAQLGPAGGADADAPIAIADAPEDVVLVLTGGIGGKVTHLPTWMGGTRSVTAEVVPLR